MIPSYTYLLVSILLCTGYVVSQHFTALKLSPPFPSVPYPSNIAATFNATFDRAIPEYTFCYRFLLESYNTGMLKVFGAPKDAVRSNWWIHDRIYPKDGGGADGYQGGTPHIGRNVPGGGIGSREMPSYHYVLYPQAPLLYILQLCQS